MTGWGRVYVWQKREGVKSENWYLGSCNICTLEKHTIPHFFPHFSPTSPWDQKGPINLDLPSYSPPSPCAVTSPHPHASLPTSSLTFVWTGDRRLFPPTDKKSQATTFTTRWSLEICQRFIHIQKVHTSIANIGQDEKSVTSPQQWLNIGLCDIWRATS